VSLLLSLSVKGMFPHLSHSYPLAVPARFPCPLIRLLEVQTSAVIAMIFDSTMGCKLASISVHFSACALQIPPPANSAMLLISPPFASCDFTPIQIYSRVLIKHIRGHEESEPRSVGASSKRSRHAFAAATGPSRHQGSA